MKNKKIFPVKLIIIATMMFPVAALCQSDPEPAPVAYYTD